MGWKCMKKGWIFTNVNNNLWKRINTDIACNGYEGNKKQME